MSSETERITNQVMNRPPWDKLEERLHKAGFEDAENRQRTGIELLTTNRRSARTGDAFFELPQ